MFGYSAIKMGASYIKLGRSSQQLEGSLIKLRRSSSKLEGSSSKLEGSPIKLEGSSHKLEHSLIKLRGSSGKLGRSSGKMGIVSRGRSGSMAGAEQKSVPMRHNEPATPRFFGRLVRQRWRRNSAARDTVEGSPGSATKLLRTATPSCKPARPSSRTPSPSRPNRA